MKTIKLTILCLAFPLTFCAQSLTGLWMGAVSNDSTTIRKDQSFEIVLTQYKDKVYGYSRSTFIVHDTLFYIVKRVKGTIEGDVCEVKDDKIVSHNFPGRVDKGVKMISTFRFNSNDSTWHLDGDWKTNKTKKYYAVSGKISLKSEPNIEQSRIFPHLEELKLADDVAFYKESKKAQQTVAVTTPPVKDTKKDEIAKNTVPRDPVTQPKVQTRKDMMAKKEETASTSPKTAPVTETKQPVKDIPKETVAVETKKPEEKVSVKQEQQNPVATISKPVEEKKETIKPSTTAEEKVVKEEPKNPVATISKPVEEKKETIKPSTTVEEKVIKEEPKNSVATTSKPVEQKKETINTPVVIEEKKSVPAAPIAAAMIKERKIAAPQIVNYKSDTLELSLYDNGEVDGDTVSVLFNGEIILAKQGLKASAIKKTIYIPANNVDNSTLVLYAENLGKYPPNTGLLIVRDGEETYQIRFSADLSQNAAVIFKRKRN